MIMISRWQSTRWRRETTMTDEVDRRVSTDDTDELRGHAMATAAAPRQWVRVVTVTPMAVTVVSVVNGVSSMSDDAPPAPAEIDFAPHAWLGPGCARAAPPVPSTSRTHPLYTYTTDPALCRYLQFNNKQPKTYKALSMYKHDCHTRTFVT